MTQLFANNATTTLASGITSNATSLTVATGTGALFPTITGSDYFLVTLATASTEASREIVKVTARSSDTFTIVRAQEGTTGTAFLVGATVDLRETAGTFNNFTQDAELTGEAATRASADSTLTTAVAGKAATIHTHVESDVTNLVSDLAAKAPLASPTFTGTPTAPTATTGTNTTQIATTAFVTTAVGAGGGGGTDATKLPLAGGTMTGDIALGLHKVTATTAAGAVASIGTVASDANGMTLLQYTPSETAADPFYMGLTQADVPPAQARADQIMMLGWNLNAGGSRVNTASGHGAIGLSMEQCYETGPSAAQMEMHWLAVDPAGVQRRLMSVESRLYSPYDTRLFIAANHTQFCIGNDSSGVQTMVMDSTLLRFDAPTGVFRTTYNASQWLNQVLDVDGVTEIAHVALNESADLSIKARNGTITDSNNKTRATWDVGKVDINSPNGLLTFEVENPAIWFYTPTVDILKATGTLVTLGTPLKVVGGFGCNGTAAQAAYASGGTLAGVVAALVANGILSN